MAVEKVFDSIYIDILSVHSILVDRNIIVKLLTGIASNILDDVINI